MHGFLQDLTFSWRRLRRRRGLALLAVATLALALGINTALYSVFNAFLLHPLPYPQPQHLAWIAVTTPPRPGTDAFAEEGFSAPDFVAYRAQSRQFSLLVADYPNVATLQRYGSPEHVAYANVSGGFFDALGVHPTLGRGIAPADELSPVPQIAVLSAGLWRQRYGADPGILGHTLDLDDHPLTVVGIMPPEFDYPPGAQLWTPEPLYSPLLQNRNTRYLEVIGRLREGATLGGAQRELTAVSRRLADAYPLADGAHGVVVRSLAEHASGPFRATLWMIMGAAGLVLAMACANIANLLLAGAVERWREMALRSALGARRRRLLRQLATEGLLLAACGGATGALLAVALMPLLRRLRPPGLPPLQTVPLDGAVLAFTALATLGTAAWLGLAPAWELLRPQSGRSLHRASAGAHPSRSRLAACVAAAEVAAAMVLLAGAGLLLQSLLRLQRVDPGFDPAHVLTARASLLFNDLNEMYAGAPFFSRLDQRLQTLPGVEAAGLVSELPLDRPAYQLPFYVAGSSGAALPLSQRPHAELRHVLPGYFQALRIPLSGRAFTAADTPTSARVVIVNQSLAQSLFPGQDPLGHFLVWGANVNARIVGVAGNVREDTLARPSGWDVYEPFPQSPVGDMSVVVRTHGDPWALLPLLQRQVAELNPQIAVYEADTLASRIRTATAPDRFRAGLLLAMAGLALLLAVAGVYGVLAHSVAQRRREIGIRMALGATPAQVRGMVLRQSLRLILAGVAAGLLVSWWSSRMLQRWLVGISPYDPLTLMAVAVLLIAVALVASYLPARQASRVDPIIALRSE